VAPSEEVASRRRPASVDAALPSAPFALAKRVSSHAARILARCRREARIQRGVGSWSGVRRRASSPRWPSLPVPLSRLRRRAASRIASRPLQEGASLVVRGRRIAARREFYERAVGRLPVACLLGVGHQSGTTSRRQPRIQALLWAASAAPLARQLGGNARKGMRDRVGGLLSRVGH